MGVRCGTRWLLFVAVAAGLIGMHHLMLLCAGEPDAVAHEHTVLPSITSVSAVMPGPAVDLPPGGCCALLGHVCLAVLAAVITLLLGLALALGTAEGGVDRRAGLTGSAPGARAPPDTGVRLSTLCVWRC